MTGRRGPAFEIVLGVDVGTGGVRAVAVDANGTTVAVAEVLLTVPTDPNEPIPAAPFLEGMIEAARHIVREQPRMRPRAMAVGGQGPTTVDLRSGLALTYRGRFGKDRPPEEQYHAQAEGLASAAGEPVEPRQLWDWLLESLGAEPHQGRWPGQAAVDGFGHVRHTGEVVGSTRLAALSGATGELLLVAGAADALLARWAAGLDRPGRALDQGGRSGGLAVAVAGGTRVHSMWTHAGAAVGTDILGAPVSAHGLSLDWLAAFSERPISDLLEMAAAVPPGANGLTFLPYLEGERAPRFDAGLRGVIAGLHPQSTLADLARAVLEGSAYGLAHVAQAMREAGVAIDVLVCAGRPARSELWCAIKSAVLEVPVERSEVDLAAFGAALAAGAAVGWWPRPREGGAGSWPGPPMSTLAADADVAYRAGLRRFIALGDEVTPWTAR